MLHRARKSLGTFGLSLDGAANQQHADRPQRISASDSKIVVYIIHAEEDLMIARHVAHMCRASLM